MKISKKKAAENRELILTSAAKLFRERGVPGVGVDSLFASYRSRLFRLAYRIYRR
ncbi:hypothetical protein [Terriglobus saanensis]|uniref:TetR family transcriptional regulator n=1 Tax=Terriglobus saanensis (strain ATCC BAA-1853 / DSM 23119 / SP1PR4) TaxID=401053 RepID=E8UYI3_TERSS|nr:hypothetical protein [Terriglobus saanensis]ADV83136.1 hypothetical protein AciPR4_2356 [Terriglobus saanensis SP1PR4]